MKKLLKFYVYVKPTMWYLIGGLICGALFGATSGFGMPVVFDKVLRKIFEEQGNAEQSVWYIIGIALLLPIVFSLRAIFGYLSGYLMTYVSLEVLRKMKADIFSKIQSYPIAFFDNFTTGDLMTRLSSDTAVVQNILLNFSSEMFRQPLQALGAVVFLFYICFTKGEVAFLFFFIAAVPFCILPVQSIRKNLRRYAGKSQVEAGVMTQIMSENLDAAHEVRVFNLQDSQTCKFDISNQNFKRLCLKISKYELLQQPFMEVLSATLVSATFVYAYYGKIDFSTFAAVGVALYMTIDPAKRIIRMFSDLVKTAPLIDRINEILDYESPVPDAANPVKVDNIKGDLSFENVSFSYNEKPVLIDASVSIPAGTSCALVGESGAGKSTFAKLAMRLYDPISGVVKMDGISLKDFDKKTYASFLGSVPQYPVLFNDTVYNNILIARPDATREEVELAAKNACAHDFILDLENGYDTSVGERGDRLSGGQKQRIAIARVFLKNPPFIVLDEATSALDANSESAIQRAVDNLMKDRTMLVIAHRFSTIKNVGMIIVFKEGRIIDYGTHEQLMERCAHYNHLYTRQMSRIR